MLHSLLKRPLYFLAQAASIFTLASMLCSCDSKVEEGPGNEIPGGAVQEESVSDSVAPITAFIAKTTEQSDTEKLFEQGVRLAKEGDAKVSLDFKFLDAAEGRSPESAALKTSVEKDHAPAVIYWTVDDIAPVASYLRNSETVGVVAGEVTEAIVPLGAHVFGFGYSSELTIKQLTKLAGNVLKSYRFAVIESDQPRFDAQGKIFIEETKSLGNTIVFEEKVNAESADYSALVARASKEKCDSIFAVLPTRALIRFVQAARAAKYQGKIYLGDTLFAPDIAALGASAEGIYMFQAWSDDQSLKERYLAANGGGIDGISLGFVALGYDFARCLQGVGLPLNGSAIRSSFLSQSCEGLTGKTQFTGERMAQRRKRILSIKNGQVMLAEDKSAP